MRIMFFVGSLKMGGVERGVAKISSYWAAQGYDVAIVTITDIAEDFYPYHKKIMRIGLNLMEPRKTLSQKVRLQIRRMRAFPRAVKSFNPDVILSFATDCNILALETAFLHDVPVVISERNNHDMKIVKHFTALLRRILYPFARRIVFVSQGVADSFRWVHARQKVTILNSLEKPDMTQTSPREKNIVALGRLVPAKGFDILISAFAAIAPKHPDWSLSIYGDGPSKQDLQSMIDTHQMGHQVCLAGHTKNPAAVLGTAGIFVLSSRYEGLPNALMEAMSTGAPCIAFDCPSGPSELIVQNTNGLLVPAENETLLQKAITYMIENPELRAEMGMNASHINDDLSIEKIMLQWDHLIQQVVKA